MEKKRYHILTISIIFAFLMWISVNLSQEETIISNIPIVIKNLQEGKALKYPIPKFVTVRLKGTGWQLASLYFLKRIDYIIDLSLHPEPYIVTNRNPAEFFKLPSSVTPLDIKPETLWIALENHIKKNVPIVPQLDINYRNGYGQVGEVHIIPESITVSGAISQLAHIHQWKTTYKRYDNHRTTIDINLALEEPGTLGLEIHPKNVRIIVNVQPFAEKTIMGILVNAISVPSNREVIFIPPKVDIIVRGGVDELTKLSPDDFQITFDYQNLVQDTTGFVTPNPRSLKDVKVIKRIPEKIRFIIRKQL